MIVGSGKQPWNRIPLWDTCSCICKDGNPFGIIRNNYVQLRSTVERRFQFYISRRSSTSIKSGVTFCIEKRGARMICWLKRTTGSSRGIIIFYIILIKVSLSCSRFHLLPRNEKFSIFRKIFYLTSSTWIHSLFTSNFRTIETSK